MPKKTKKAEPQTEPRPAPPREIVWSGRFTRDYKRERKGQHRATLDGDLTAVLDTLANRLPLEPRHNDHALKGEWQDYRDCHVRPDLVLIYRLPDDDTVQLARMGSHSELGI